jgi:hypothetical protein
MPVCPIDRKSVYRGRTQETISGVTLVTKVKPEKWNYYYFKLVLARAQVSNQKSLRLAMPLNKVLLRYSIANLKVAVIRTVEPQMMERKAPTMSSEFSTVLTPDPSSWPSALT